jgi:armadillo repeat-containing protein 8
VNSMAHQHEILAHPRILFSLRKCLVDAKVDVRRPAVSCVRELIRVNPHSYKELHEVGIDATLRHMCDYGGGLIASSPTTSSLSMGVEEDSEVREKAREALRWLERSGELGI